MPTTILAIESSCDDTGAAVLADGKVLANIVASQLIHAKYGGVVPEVASRMHNESIWPVVESALEKAEITPKQLSAIACTRGPGLMGSLLVGYTFAKALAYALNIPLIGVHHMQAHVLAHFLSDPSPAFPFICLTVSGGHTQLVRIDNHLEMTVLGQSLDDAAGEAFDKTGKLFNLPYPAGPEIDKIAQKGKAQFQFAKPNIDGLDFSFSGLKTSILYFVRDKIKEDPKFIQQNLPDLCASVQHSIVDILMQKLEAAAELHGIRQIAIAGGVAANSELRKQLKATALVKDWQVYIPKVGYCTDNAAMIGIAGHYKYLHGLFDDLESKPDPRLSWEQS